MQIIIPGYAVLAKVLRPDGHAEGPGYFCAFAVRAVSQSEAEQRVQTELAAAPDTASVSIEDTRALVPGEIPDTVDFQALGARIPIQAGPSDGG
ncbi:hypothetical protein E4Z66_11740 [Aliishimia ponticola]|uniref:Uncharacterized protein n=1 Tax=Aliishimia ponticola TaxID=2499833 RepID=A0A4V6S211_9RHOB|nr:hypothetical protein [Aliishimia ponticola]THH35753.1 hypothetical protein E4Z66_11740 [Aliishimia ponticola]